jgi:hypothetical protein
MLSPFAQTLKIREQNQVSRRLNHIAQQVTLSLHKMGNPQSRRSSLSKNISRRMGKKSVLTTISVKKKLWQPLSRGYWLPSSSNNKMGTNFGCNLGPPATKKWWLRI